MGEWLLPWALLLEQSGVGTAVRTSTWIYPAAEIGHLIGLGLLVGTAVAFGLPRDVAVQAITLAPARILGLESEVGSIQPGKLANLVITDGDPLEIRTNVQHVIIKGVAVPLETRHTRLYEKYRSRPKPAGR